MTRWHAALTALLLAAPCLASCGSENNAASNNGAHDDDKVAVANAVSVSSRCGPEGPGWAQGSVRSWDRLCTGWRGERLRRPGGLGLPTLPLPAHRTHGGPCLNGGS
jgi:hypothetical protein